MKYIKKFNESNSEKEKTIKYRDHSGSLESSLKSIKDFTKDELERHLRNKYEELDLFDYPFDGFKIKEYYDKEDSKTGWKKTYLVQMKIGNSYIPAGYSDDKF